jgi:hypothetical protein
MPVLTQEIKYGEDNSIDAVPTLTDEEKNILEEKKKTLDKLFSDGGRKAKYKLEVLFGKKYSLNTPSHGAVTFWESGRKFHGGGDTKLYICPGKKLNRSECDAFIPESAQGYGHLVCPKCGQVWKGDEVIGELMFRLTSQGWCTVLLKYFLKMELDADIKIKYPPEDIRSMAIAEQEKQRGGELLDTARGKRMHGAKIYPMMNIIKDTSSGSSLESRIMAFIRS